MHGAINWEKRKRKLDGVYGIEQRPYYGRKGALPTKSQMDYIDDLVSQLEDAGVEAAWIIEDGEYKKHAGSAISVIRLLNKMRKEAGIGVNARVEYVNLCKEKETGKRIRYRTFKRFAAPVGYELIGELSRRYVYPEVG